MALNSEREMSPEKVPLMDRTVPEMAGMAFKLMQSWYIPSITSSAGGVDVAVSSWQEANISVAFWRPVAPVMSGAVWRAAQSSHIRVVFRKDAGRAGISVRAMQPL